MEEEGAEVSWREKGEGESLKRLCFFLSFLPVLLFVVMYLVDNVGMLHCCLSCFFLEEKQLLAVSIF